MKKTELISLHGLVEELGKYISREEHDVLSQYLEQERGVNLEEEPYRSADDEGLFQTYFESEFNTRYMDIHKRKHAHKEDTIEKMRELQEFTAYHEQYEEAMDAEYQETGVDEFNLRVSTDD